MPVRKKEHPVNSPDKMDASPQKHPQTVPQTSLILLSATVHPGPVTRVSWTGQDSKGRPVTYSGWSNIDFNHFSGFSSFRASDGTIHALIMGIGDSETPEEKVPIFKSDSPEFIADGKIPTSDLNPIAALHELYEKEGQRLAAAHAGRKKAAALRKAELLANPPQPRDLIIRYRIAETPSDNEGGTK